MRPFLRRAAWRAVVFGVLLSPGIGCAGPTATPWPAEHPASMHVIAVDHLGRSIDPDHPGAFENVESADALRARIRRMSGEIDKWAGMNGGKYRDVLIFAHGGLNDPVEAINGAAEKVGPMLGEGYYPIFIVWNSKLESSYGEHLTHVRQGNYYENSWWAAPVFLLSDLGRALFRAPIVWGRQIDNDSSRIGANFSAWYHKEPDRIFRDNRLLNRTGLMTIALLEAYRGSVGEVTTPEAADAITEGEAHVSIPDINELPDGTVADGNAPGGWRIAAYAATVPLKFLSSPLLDSTGSAAWHNMYRRAMILFEGEQTFAVGDVRTADDARDELERSARRVGPLEALLRMLHEKAPAGGPNPAPETTWEGEGRPFRVTLIGHSMGAIVLNEFVRRGDDVDFARIVYMAAACSVREFQGTVQRYMAGRPATLFYNLTLHPANELREVEGYEVPPRGSLLVWIDDMFGAPHTPADQTLGRWDNAVDMAYGLPPAIRGRVRLKAFGMDAQDEGFRADLEMPQRHGDFTHCDYWREAFWQPDAPDVAAAKFQKTQDQTLSRPATPAADAIHQKGEGRRREGAEQQQQQQGAPRP